MLHIKKEGNGLIAKLRLPVVAVLAIGLVASATPSHAAQTAPKQIRILYATAEANSAAVQAALPSFKAKTGVELVMDTMPYNALQTKVFAEFAVKSSYYYVVIVDTPWSPALAQSLEPLSGYMTNASLNDLAPLNAAVFIPKVFYDTAVYYVKNPSLHYPKPTAKDSLLEKPPNFAPKEAPINLPEYAITNTISVMYKLKFSIKFIFKPILTKNKGAKILEINW